MLKIVHPVAGLIAILTIVTFWFSTALSRRTHAMTSAKSAETSSARARMAQRARTASASVTSATTIATSFS